MQLTSIKPPFSLESALHAVQLTEELWNAKCVDEITQRYAPDGFYFRYRGKELTSRVSLREALLAKWNKEYGYTIKKSLQLFSDNQITVQFMYEWQDEEGGEVYYRTYGNEFWQVNSEGKIIYHTMSSNDVRIKKEELLLETRPIYTAKYDKNK